MFNRSIKVYLLVAAVTGLSFFSCSEKEEIKVSESPATTQSAEDEVSIVNGRMSFKNYKSFSETATRINNMTDEERIKWQKRFSFTALNNSLKEYDNSESTDPLLEDLKTFNFPISHLTILNSKGEFQFGDTIAWYHNGYRHYVPNGNEKELNEIKKQPSISKVKSEAGGTVVKTKNSSNENARVVLGTYSLDARHQHQFFAGGDRKYVHEIISFRDTYIVDEISLYLRIKMEWKGRKGSWKPAGERRDINFNLNYSFSCYADGWLVLNAGGNKSGAHYNVNDIHITLLDKYLTVHRYVSYQWHVDISGYIDHSYAGGAYRWYNAGYPLW